MISKGCSSSATRDAIQVPMTLVLSRLRAICYPVLGVCLLYVLTIAVRRMVHVLKYPQGEKAGLRGMNWRASMPFGMMSQSCLSGPSFHTRRLSFGFLVPPAQPTSGRGHSMAVFASTDVFRDGGASPSDIPPVGKILRRIIRQARQGGIVHNCLTMS